MIPEKETGKTMTEVKLCTYHCPRWEELPALGLYLDQVMLVLDSALGPITPGTDRVVITPTIINNYVKQKVLAPTQKKKYDRTQLADLIMIALLKRALSTAEIVCVLNALKAEGEPQPMYDAFCAELENDLRRTAGAGGAGQAQLCPPVVQAAVRALAGKISFELLLDEAAQQDAAQRAEEARRAAEAKKQTEGQRQTAHERRKNRAAKTRPEPDEPAPKETEQPL